jgi:hypothetical protein
LACRKPVPALPQVTAEEVQAAKKACVRAKQLYRAQQSAERDRDAALFQIFFKMGFSSLDDVKAMSPERLRAEIERRASVSFSFESDEAKDFTILKTWEGRRPDWKAAFLRQAGPAMAVDVEKAARTHYFYSIIERLASSDVQPGVVYLPKRAKAS